MRNGTRNEIMNPIKVVEVRLYIPTPFRIGARR